MYTTNDAGAKITPADYLASATIASAWKKSQTKNDDVLFYNCTSTNENTFLWRESFEKNKHLFMEYAPYKKIIWYPNLTFTSSYIWNMTCLILFQLFPAMFLDLFRMLSGKKPIFTSLQMKVIKGIKIFYYFTTRNFLFETDKLHNLFNSLDKDDKIKFYFDHTTIYWPDYFENGGRNLRKYILKESELNIPKAQQKLRKLYYADRSLKIFGVLLLSYYLWQLTQWVLT
ncbi:CLUMA_CG017470, isoform A [Clunio marinus]|uniref:CLUMA_CG017470, isoform A n=1 Tax=Clunio marinus TaxID=568069 RepID=A0A1J1IVT2_9DIPT|nr:CLUMA_CG017470, isoform A [Clunio marinus]